MPMKLLKLEIEGFRSLRHVVWEPGDLNILIGPNAGGKSNLLKALEFISVAARGSFGDYVERQGGAAAIAWDGNARKIRFSIDMAVDVDGRDRRFTYILELGRGAPPSTLQIELEELYRPLDEEPRPNRRLFKRTRDSIIMTDGDIEKAHPAASAVLRDDNRTLLSQVAEPIVGNPSFAACGKFLSEWMSYFDFHTDSGADVRRSVIPRQSRNIDPDGQNLANVLNTYYRNDARFTEIVDDSMNAAFLGQYLELVFPINTADQRLSLAVRWKDLSSSTATADLSDGTLRFLYLLAILANPHPPTLIAIDEPETGLHPSMLPLIAEAAADAAERTQVVFTTHSSEFLDAFHIVEIKPQIGVVEFTDGASDVKTIADEVLAHWLKGFRLGELYRTHGLEIMP